VTLGKAEGTNRTITGPSGQTSVYPFNEYESMISHLLAAGKLTLQAYLGILGTGKG